MNEYSFIYQKLLKPVKQKNNVAAARIFKMNILSVSTVCYEVIEDIALKRPRLLKWMLHGNKYMNSGSFDFCNWFHSPAREELPSRYFKPATAIIIRSINQ